MEPDLTDRRKHARMSATESCWRAIRLRTGDPLALVNVAPGGALVDSARRLLPGTRVVLQVNLDDKTLTVGAAVVRCEVHALWSDAVQYRGALAFEEEHACERVARCLDACA